MDVFVSVWPPGSRALPFKAVNLSKLYLISADDNSTYLIGTKVYKIIHREVLKAELAHSEQPINVIFTAIIGDLFLKGLKLFLISL